MLDNFTILSQTGVVLWSKDFGVEIKGSPIDSLIKEVLLEERNAETTHTHLAYALKWTFENELGLIFIAVYQKMLRLTYVEGLLEAVKTEFCDSFRSTVHNPSAEFDFSNQFDKLLRSAEQDANKKQRARGGATGSRAAGGGNPAKPAKTHTTKPQQEQEQQESENKNNEEERNGGSHVTPSSQQDEIAANLAKLEAKFGKRGARRSGSKKEKKPEAPQEPVKREKKGRVWGEGKKKDAKSLDRSGATQEEIDRANAIMAQERQQQLQDQSSGFDLDAPLNTDDQDDYYEDDLTDSDSETETTSKKQSGGVWSFFKGLTGNKALTREDLKPVLDKMKDSLMEKNVAADIAEQCCESVCVSLVGKTNATFTRVQSTVREAMEDALTRVLTPKRSYDILGDVMQKKALKKPYVIVFMGVNGVGKSTSLSKVCFWLLQNKMKVMLAACDTFRSGSIEQLNTHASCLGVEVFSQGYDKDASRVAGNAVKSAEEKGIDVVLVDTAGRMQNNEPLMRSLVKLVTENNPDLVLFVGEALVGNDGVDQLSEFNQSLKKFQHTNPNPRVIDGIFLTKFDTISDKVGAALSMVYTTGQPILFVGVGQSYTDIRRLNVKSVVNSLLK